MVLGCSARHGYNSIRVYRWVGYVDNRIMVLKLDVPKRDIEPCSQELMRRYPTLIHVVRQQHSSRTLSSYYLIPCSGLFLLPCGVWAMVIHFHVSQTISDPEPSVYMTIACTVVAGPWVCVCIFGLWVRLFDSSTSAGGLSKAKRSH